MDTSDILIEMAPVNLGHGELGLIAKEDMEAGDILVWAPKSMLLNVEKAVDLWGEVVAELPNRLALSLLLIEERFVQGKKSNWTTYIDTLPGFDGDVSGPSFLWQPDEWKWLEGSDCYDASIQMRESFLNEYDQLNGTLFAENPQLFPRDAFSLNNFLWAVAVVASRAYGDDEQGTNLAIAPLVDFLNHRAGSLQLTRFGNGIVAYAHKKYFKGEQVWVNYGGKPNAQMLSQYGFVDDGAGYEAVYLRMGDHLPALAEPHSAAKLRLFEEMLGEDVDANTAIFKLTVRSRDWDGILVPALRILTLASDDPAPVTYKELLPRQRPRHEAAAWGLLVDAIDARAAEYPMSLAEARQQLAEGGPTLPERQSLGLRLRISEQELLELTRTEAANRRDLALKDCTDAAPATAGV